MLLGMLLVVRDVRCCWMLLGMLLDVVRDVVGCC